MYGEAATGEVVSGDNVCESCGRPCAPEPLSEKDRIAVAACLRGRSPSGDGWWNANDSIYDLALAGFAIVRVKP